VVWDWFGFATTLVGSRIDVVQLNPSLDPRSLVRDGALLLIAKAMKKPVVVLIHGWMESTEREIANRYRWAFRAVYGRADAIFVLHSRFRGVLRGWGCVQPIHTTTSVIDPACLAAVGRVRDKDVVHARMVPTVLFMARIMEQKGIHQAIEAIGLAVPRIPDVRLLVAGDGPELTAAREHVQRADLGGHVEFLGDVRGEKKVGALLASSIYLLPTKHPEGMPTTVLEAMALSLIPIVPLTAGLADFLEDGVLGVVEGSTDPRRLCAQIDRVWRDAELRARIGLTAQEYALCHFTPLAVARRLDRVYAELLAREDWPNSVIDDRDWFVMHDDSPNLLPS